jgi:NAD(P)H-quinone oxidoreductase subunit 5
MLEQATPARILLLLLGLATTLLAGLVMLTRISIKVSLAWSTVAQMGFMLLECALGLYTFAALHLIGHSLYKADAFLSASAIVRQTRLQALHGTSPPAFMSLVLAPVLTSLVVILLLTAVGYTLWPWWWSCLLGLAWAPLLWIPALCTDWSIRIIQALFGLLIAVGLTLTAIVGHVLPFGIQDAPHQSLGLIALGAMVCLYLCQMLVQQRPQVLSRWHRWSYAGFYVDEIYTRLALRIWPTHWTPEPSRCMEPKAAAIALAETLR